MALCVAVLEGGGAQSRPCAGAGRVPAQARSCQGRRPAQPRRKADPPAGHSHATVEILTAQRWTGHGCVRQPLSPLLLPRHAIRCPQRTLTFSTRQSKVCNTHLLVQQEFRAGCAVVHVLNCPLAGPLVQICSVALRSAAANVGSSEPVHLSMPYVALLDSHREQTFCGLASHETACLGRRNPWS